MIRREDIQHLIIELPSWVGDCVMATPLLREIRAAIPDATITGIMRPGLDQLFNGSPFLDQLRTVQPRGVKGVFRSAKLIKSLDVDAILLLPNSFRSALAARLGKVPTRIGYARDGRGMLLTDGIAYSSQSMTVNPIPRTTLDDYLALGKSAFNINLTTIDRTAELSVTEDEKHAARQLLHDVTIDYIVLNPGGNREDKRWPLDRFARIAEYCHKEKQLAVLINGGPSEADLIAEIQDKASAPTINLLERGNSLGSLKAILKNAQLLITNDTGPRHIAAALGTAIISLFGPTDHRWTILPGIAERRLLAEPFLPAELIADHHPVECSIDRIHLNDVISAVDVMLESLMHDLQP